MVVSTWWFKLCVCVCGVTAFNLNVHPLYIFLGHCNLGSISLISVLAWLGISNHGSETTVCDPWICLKTCQYLKSQVLLPLGPVLLKQKNCHSQRCSCSTATSMSPCGAAANPKSSSSLSVTKAPLCSLASYAPQTSSAGSPRVKVVPYDTTFMTYEQLF